MQLLFAHEGCGERRVGASMSGRVASLLYFYAGRSWPNGGFQ